MYGNSVKAQAIHFKPDSMDREGLSRMSDRALLNEYREMRRASFNAMFGHNAKRRGNACAEELLSRGITHEPNIFGDILISFFNQ